MIPNKQCLPTSGIARLDSDDELGMEDYPWEWVFFNGNPHGTDYDKIIGARMGAFSCTIGDTVFLKAEGQNEAWVAVICDFLVDSNGKKSANFMWFSSEKEIRNKSRKRMDYMENELYITPSWDINPLTSINGHAIILSPREYTRRYPLGTILPSARADMGKVFVCRRGCNTRTAIYTVDFVWEDIYAPTEDGVYELIRFVEANTKSELNLPSGKIVDGDGVLNSSNLAQAPRKGVNGKNKRQLTFMPLATRNILATNDLSLYQLARSRLHVSAVPDSLPCREKEFQELYGRLTEAISDGDGNCFYISGTPGTGKTATVREVISHLEHAVIADELEDFIFVEVNGMKLTDPYQAYSLLWEALHNQRVSPSQALDLLEHEFNNPSPRRIPCVVLMDELDQLVTRNQGIMYNFFNWPSLRHSKLIVLAVANTMDLPERTLSNKISSRLGLTRMTFPGYTHDQLVRVVQSRLEGIEHEVIEHEAIQFASRKIAAVSGDARRALDICRRAVEMVETAAIDGLPSTGNINYTQSNYLKVSISTIMKAINEAISSPIQIYIGSLPWTTKLILMAIMQRVRRAGTNDTTVGEICNDAVRYIMGMGMIIKVGTLMQNINLEQTITGAEMGHVVSELPLKPALLELANAGIIALESHRTDSLGKIRLVIGTDDIMMAMNEDHDLRNIPVV